MRKAPPKILAVAVALLVATLAPAAGEEPTDGHGPDDPEGHVEESYFEFGEDLAAAASGGVFFSESSGCDGAAGIATPMSTTDSSANRSLPAGHTVRGPWGDFFGRNYQDVAGSMVNWTVPMSGGKTVKVHQRALPAFQQVSANLAAEAAKGRHYSARIVASFVWRRIGGSYRMSTHSFGSTIDINWDTNPFSERNQLVTDMPQWYVDAWRDAGFCWGGDWVSAKDPMHFSWKGPIATAGYGTVPAPFAPDTAAAAYTQVAYTGTTTFGGMDPEAKYAFADGNRDAAPDLFRLTTTGADDLKVEYARSSRDFQFCGVSTAVIRGGASEPGELLVADFDGDARPDVWRISTSSGKVNVKVHTYAEGYADSISIQTAASAEAGATYLAGDYNRDGLPDLYVVGREGSTRVRVFSGASSFGQKLVDVVTQLPPTPNHDRWKFTLADRDVDGIPDLIGLRVDGDVALRAVAGSGGYSGPVASSTTSTAADRAGVYDMGDYDGDGRPDVLSLRSNGKVAVHLGGVQSQSPHFWFQPDDWTCDGAGSNARWDVNGDRIADVVVGITHEDVGSVRNAGAASVIFGSPTGPTAQDDQWWSQDAPPLEGLAEAEDQFGSEFAWGDFNGDGIGDIAFGAGRDGVGTVAGAGLLNVIHGSVDGLDGADSQLWHQDSAGVLGVAQTGDGFATALASGDFNGDGWDDLAVGGPHDLSGAGVVNVLYGSKLGLTAAGDDLWYQDAPGVEGVSEDGDEFGREVVAGDFNDDGYDDLAIGVPGEAISTTADAGLVNVLYGGSGGLGASGDAVFHQQTPGIGDAADKGDRFGAALAVGDFDGDGYEDLAVGAPGEYVAGKDMAGQVHILFGGSAGLSASGSTLLNQSSPGIPGGSEWWDRFGIALAAGDVDGDGFSDLAIGAWGEDIGSIKNAGMVTTINGSSTGLKAATARAWTQGGGGLLGTSEAQDRFGTTVRLADLNGDGLDDLMIGTPREDLSVPNAGALFIIFATPSGLSSSGAEVWHQNTAGVSGAAEAWDRFGTL